MIVRIELENLKLLKQSESYEDHLEVGGEHCF